MNYSSFLASALFTCLRGAKWHADELQQFSRLSFVHMPTRREMACRRIATVFAPQLCSHAYEARNGMPTNCNSFRASALFTCLRGAKWHADELQQFSRLSFVHMPTRREMACRRIATVFAPQLCSHAYEARNGMPTNCNSFRASALFTCLRGAKWHADELQQFSRLSFVHMPTRREMACRRIATVFAPQLCSHAYEARNGMPTNCNSFRASALFTRLRGAKWHADELQQFSRLSFVHTPTRREMACRITATVFAPLRRSSPSSRT